MQYKILQFKDIKKVNYAFMDYDYAVKHGFKLSDYVEVYAGDIRVDRKDKIFNTLDDIFTKFNIDRPEDFQGHSLSVSDLIQVEDALYYVDCVGFQQVEVKE